MCRTDRNRLLSSPLLFIIAGALLIGLAAPASAQLNKTQHDDGWIVAAAHAPGLEGSIWRTDLWIMGETYTTGTVTLRFCKAERDNTDATPFEVHFGQPGKVVYFEDVVDHFLDLGNAAWVGAIHYESTVPVQVFARVYTISADGSASYGQMIEGVPTADMTMSYSSPDFPGTREDQRVFAMKHTADGRYRVNIGMVNPTAVEAEIGIGVFTTDGNFPPGDRYFIVTVPPYSMVQLGDPLAHLYEGEWNNLIVRFETGTEGAGVFGYASVVDNVTNDAYFVRGTKRYGPDGP